MSNIASNILKIKESLQPILGEVQTRHYFSRYRGFFKNNILLGLYRDERFFLKFSPQHLPEILQESSTQQLNDPSLRMCTKYFYLLPPIILQDIQQYAHWFDYLQKESLNTKTKFIRNLPNMSYSLECLLARNGINSVQQLNELGAVNTFVRLIQRGEDISEMLLFKLHGALTHRFVISEDTKRSLLKEADEALYSIGLRKRFTNRY